MVIHYKNMEDSFLEIMSSFFKGKVNFNEESIQKKSIAISYILKKFGIIFSNRESFHLSCISGKANLTCDLFDDLFSLLGIVDFTSLEVEDGFKNRFAYIIGQVLNIYERKSEDVDSFYENVAIILFVQTNCLVNATIEELMASKYISCSMEELKIILESIRLLNYLRNLFCGIGKQSSDSKVKKENLDVIFSLIRLLK